MIQLVYMPFGSITHPSIALGRIQAQLTEVGLESRVHYLNLQFARRVGYGRYERVALLNGSEPQVGEWVFAKAAWGPEVDASIETFLSRCDGSYQMLPVHERDWLQQLRDQLVAPFLDDCTARLLANPDCRVVAFSCSFFQTMAALALGRRLKKARPELALVYGGACFHGDAGAELFEKAPWVDVVSVGEADDVIPALFSALHRGEHPVGLHGMHCRFAGHTSMGKPVQPISATVLNALPAPSYGEFFDELRALGLDGAPSYRTRCYLPFESSRGCWWGTRRHCTFCGLNAEHMAHRQFDPERVVATLADLSERHPQVSRWHATDNILPASAFARLLPMLESRRFGQGAEIFYEVRANLRRDQVRALAQAGVRSVQPGIESLNTHLLRLLNKGMSALQNVFFLKCCRDYGIEPVWNLLVRIPGEQAEDYRGMVDWIPQLAHLRPPFGGARAVEVHRHSPYYRRFGEMPAGVLPAAWYQGIFPKQRIDLSRVAYYFDVDWESTLPPEQYDALSQMVDRWIEAWSKGSEVPRLVYYPAAAGGLRIEDTRWGDHRTVNLDAEEATVYRAIDAPASLPRIRRRLTNPVDAAWLAKLLRSLIEHGLALEEDGRLLALATLGSAPEPSLTQRKNNFAVHLVRQRVAGLTDRRAHRG